MNNWNHSDHGTRFTYIIYIFFSRFSFTLLVNISSHHPKSINSIYILLLLRVVKKWDDKILSSRNGLHHPKINLSKFLNGGLML
jgi:hypothetical protein